MESKSVSNIGDEIKISLNEVLKMYSKIVQRVNEVIQETENIEVKIETPEPTEGFIGDTLVEVLYNYCAEFKFECYIYCGNYAFDKLHKICGIDSMAGDSFRINLNGEYIKVKKHRGLSAKFLGIYKDIFTSCSDGYITECKYKFALV